MELGRETEGSSRVVCRPGVPLVSPQGSQIAFGIARSLPPCPVSEDIRALNLSVSQKPRFLPWKSPTNLSPSHFISFSHKQSAPDYLSSSSACGICVLLASQQLHHSYGVTKPRTTFCSFDECTPFTTHLILKAPIPAFISGEAHTEGLLS